MALLYSTVLVEFLVILFTVQYFYLILKLVSNYTEIFRRIAADIQFLNHIFKNLVKKLLIQSYHRIANDANSCGISKNPNITLLREREREINLAIHFRQSYA